MIKKLLILFGLLFLVLGSAVAGPFGGSGPFPMNILIYDDGVLQEGSGRSVSFYTNLTATFDSSSGYYIVHGAAAGGSGLWTQVTSPPAAFQYITPTTATDEIMFSNADGFYVSWGGFPQITWESGDTVHWDQDNKYWLWAIDNTAEYAFKATEFDAYSNTIKTTGAGEFGSLVVDGNTVNLSDVADEFVLAFDVPTQTWRGVIAAGSGDVTAVFDCPSGDCRQITVEDGEYLIVTGTGEVEATETIIPVINRTGATLYGCTAVYIIEFDAPCDCASVGIADADDASKMPSIGLIEHDIADDAEGHVVVSGHNETWNTAGLTVGTNLYVNDSGTSASNSCSNTLTETKPSNVGDLVQKMGETLRAHVTLGEIIVIGAGRRNDVPILQSTYFWVGNGSNVATAVQMSQDATMNNAGAVSLAANSVSDNEIDYSNVTCNDLTMSDCGAITTTGNLIITDGNGFIVGHTSQLGIQGTTPEVQILGSGNADSTIAIFRASNNISAGDLVIAKSRGTISSPTVITTGDNLGAVRAIGHDGTDLATIAAEIAFDSEGTIDEDQIPGVVRLRTANSSGTLVDGLVIDSSQQSTFAGIIADNDDMVFECDANDNGSNSFIWTDGASTQIATLSEAGAFQIADDMIVSGGDITFGNIAARVGDGVTDSINLETDSGTVIIDGFVSTSGGSTQAGRVIFLEDTDDGSNSTTIIGSPTAANLEWILPTTNGTAGQILEIASVASNTLTLEWDDDGGAGFWTDLAPNLEPNDDGDGIQINDGGGTDFVVQSHDGDDYNFVATNTTQYTFDEPVLVDSGGVSAIVFNTAATEDPCGTGTTELDSGAYYRSSAGFLCWCDDTGTSEDLKVEDGSACSY